MALSSGEGVLRRNSPLESQSLVAVPASNSLNIFSSVAARLARVDGQKEIKLPCTATYVPSTRMVKVFTSSLASIRYRSGNVESKTKDRHSTTAFSFVVRHEILAVRDKSAVRACPL